MSGEMQLILGTIIAILLAIPGYLAAKHVTSTRQNQKVGRDGHGYQAGGDINISNDK